MAKRLTQTRWRTIPRPGPGTHGWGYLRVSTNMQVDNYSLPEQERLIRELFDREGWILDGCVEEPGLSAKDDFDSRPDWKRLVFEIAGRNGCQIIVCHDYKRWSRDITSDYESLVELRRRGVWWQTVKGEEDVNSDVRDGQDIMMAIKRVQKSSYIRVLSDEVHKGKEGKAHKGLSNGRPPFGYQYPQGTKYLLPEERKRLIYEPDPETFPILQEIGRLAALRPVLSAGVIATKLSAKGWRYTRVFRGRNQTIFTAKAVLHILARPYYRAYAPDSDRGTVLSPDGTAIEGKHLAAWDYATCQLIDTNRQLFRTKYYPNERPVTDREVYTYSGFLRCVFCNQPLIVQGGYSGMARIRTRYVCRSRRDRIECPCRQPKTRGPWPTISVREEVLNHQVTQLLAQMLPLMAQASHAIQAEAEREMREQSKAPVIDAAKILASLDQQRKRENDIYRAGESTEQEWRRNIRHLDAQKQSVLSSRPPAPVADRLARIEAVRTILDVWQRTDGPAYSHQDRVAIRRQALATVLRPNGLIYDTVRQCVMGLRPVAEFLHPFSLMLPQWQLQGEVLVQEAPDPFAGSPFVMKRTYDLLTEGAYTTNEIIGHLGTASAWCIRHTLTQAFGFGLVDREKVIPPGGGCLYRYTLVSTFDRWIQHSWSAISPRKHR